MLFRTIVCALGLLAILALFFCSYLLPPEVFASEIIVKRESGELTKNGMSLVRISRNVDLVKLKDDSSSYNCWVYSSGDEPDHDGCSLHRASFLDGENITWDVQNGHESPKKFYFVMQYKNKKMDNGGKVGLELWFVPKLISNPISVYIDG